MSFKSLELKVPHRDVAICFFNKFVSLFSIFLIDPWDKNNAATVQVKGVSAGIGSHVTILPQHVVKSVDCVGVFEVCGVVTYDSMYRDAPFFETIVIIFSCPLDRPEVKLSAVIECVTQIQYRGDPLLL